jgi:predicted membrane protein DUF2207
MRERLAAHYPDGMSLTSPSDVKPRPSGQARFIVGGLVVFAVSIVGAITVAGPSSGAAGGSIPHYAATVRVGEDGQLHVAEAVTYDFAGTPTDHLERTITTREHYDAEDDRVYDLSSVAVDAVQTDVNATITSGDTATIKLDFAQSQSDKVTVTYDYDVDGAVAQTADGLDVRWPVVQGFDLPIDKATVVWDAPDTIWLSCLAGAPGSSRPCTTSQSVDVPAPTMTQLGLAAGDQMVGILGLSADSGVAPSTDLQARWSLSRAFTASGTPLWVALAVLLVGVLAAFLLWWTRGRDIRHEARDRVRPLVDDGSGRLALAPPSGVRPGQMGTLVDEHADIVDVSSTIIDLAVRNYVFIEELPRSEFGRVDWLLRRRNDPGDELLPYEREVFDAVFTVSDSAPVSELGGTLRGRLPAVQALLYDDMVDQGWFGERPDAVRSRWTTAGWVLVAAGVVLTVVLALASTFGLVGLAVTLAGVALAGAGQVAPARTSRGSKVLDELRDFRSFLEDGDVSMIPVGQRQELISRCYPYAVVFGLGERWARALAATDPDDTPDEPLYWYGAPANWHLSDASPSLVQLAAALNAAIATRHLLAPN